MNAMSWLDRRGSVGILAAMVLPATIGVAGLALEYGDGLLIKAQSQRIADLAAYGGAIAYNAGTSPDDAIVRLNAAVARVATLNGIAASSATASFVSSPRGNGYNAILVTVAGAVPLALSKVLQTSDQVSVSASAYAEMKAAGAACIVGLAGSGNSVLEDGGATLRGTSCAVAAKSNLSMSGGATMTALGVYAGGTVSRTGGSAITTTPTANNVVQNYSGISDPVAGNAAVQAAFAGLSNLGGTVTTPAGGISLNFGYQSCPNAADRACDYYSSGGNFLHGTLPCTSGSYAIDSISVSGGVHVHISATPGCNYTIAHGINNGGSLLQIDGAAGSWNVNGGITINGGATTTFTANSYRIAGTVSLVGTVNWLTSGTSPSVQFLNAVSLGSGGGTFTFGDGNYSVNGNLTLGSGPAYFGNSQLSVNGNLTVSSGASLCSVPAPCGSGTSKMTIVDNGTNTFVGGSVVNIAAPSSGATYGIPGIAIAGNYTSSATTYAQMFSGGTGGTYAGVIYFPNSSVQFSGGANTGGSSCFEIVANVVYMGGGATTASTCTGFGANVGPSLFTLVQ
jgi:hypothetical protein